MNGNQQFKKRKVPNISAKCWAIYDVNKIDGERLSNYINYMTQRSEAMRQVAQDKSWPIFYYEDLYYGDFKPLFDELELEYNQEYYEEYLNISNRYRIGDIEIKDKNSLI